MLSPKPGLAPLQAACPCKAAWLRQGFSTTPDLGPGPGSGMGPACALASVWVFNLTTLSSGPRHELDAFSIQAWPRRSSSGLQASPLFCIVEALSPPVFSRRRARRLQRPAPLPAGFDPRAKPAHPFPPKGVPLFAVSKRERICRAPGTACKGGLDALQRRRAAMRGELQSASKGDCNPRGQSGVGLVTGRCDRTSRYPSRGIF